MDTINEREIRDRKIDRIHSSLHSLAQCAVGILSLMGILNITIVVLSVQLGNTFYLLLGVVVLAVAIVLHRIILLWGLPQLLEFACLDNDESENIGLRCLFCSIYYIEDWDLKKKMLLLCLENKGSIREMFRNAKRDVRVPFWSRRFGILALLYIALFAEIAFFVYLCFLWGFPLLGVTAFCSGSCLIPDVVG